MQGIQNSKREDERMRRDEEREGCRKGLERSFRASAKGVRTPTTEGLLGPLRTI